MLDTVLEIGRILRAAPDGLKHHRYVKKAPLPDEKNPVQFWRVPCGLDGSFDFGKREPLIDENRQKQLFYLNYKQGDADSTKKYLFGDVYRTVTKTGEDGNFRMGDLNKGSWMALNSFQRAEEVSALTTDCVKRFRDSFRTQINDIETFLGENKNVYLHFDFEGKAWQELEELDLLNKSILCDFFKQTERGYVMQVFLFKTLAAGESRAPTFQSESEYRSRVFRDENEAMSLLYGVNYASKASVRKNDVKIVVLPRGANLTARQIERFFERATSDEPVVEDENREDELVRENQASAPDEEDSLFSFLPEEDAFVQFDFIFSKAGGTKADTDMIELAGLERSKLSLISERVRAIRREVEGERTALLGNPAKAFFPLRIMQSFLNVLGDATTAKKKYQSHLLKKLPQIYTDTYMQDPVLLPALIEKTEFNIRSGIPNFNLLKFDFRFLTKLQNKGEDYLMDLQNSPSYRIGFLLGKLGKQFSGPKSPIKSFEKNYVGLLSRRIGRMDDVLQLSNDIHQKLVMHDLSKFTFRTSSELAETVQSFTGRYDKDECAFGFFESYFAPLPPKKDGEGDDQPADGENNDTESEPGA